MMKRSEILEEIRKELKKSVSDREAEVVVFSDDMDVEQINNIVKISLSSKAIGIRKDRKDFYNMQDNEAAFEGWALIIYTFFAKKRKFEIQLALKEEALEKIQDFLEMGKYLGQRGHYYRFLYRALKFSEQYSWFELEKQLGDIVTKFENYLKSGQIFENNYPDGKKEPSTEEREDENHIEDLFSDISWQESVEGKKLCENFGKPIFRQLPVGLFAEEKRTENAVFTGKKSAIDLWTCNDNGITIFELKWKNKMIGIITELFFYCNYMRDMYGVGGNISKNNFVPHKFDVRRIRNKEKYRGYYNICGRKFNKINGYMLYDNGNLHQAITENVLKEMNNAKFDDDETTISYGLIEYTAEKDVLKIGNVKTYA